LSEQGAKASLLRLLLPQDRLLGLREETGLLLLLLCWLLSEETSPLTKSALSLTNAASGWLRRLREV